MYLNNALNLYAPLKRRRAFPRITDKLAKTPDTMHPTIKRLTPSFIALGAIAAVLAFAFLSHRDDAIQVAFSLTDQHGRTVTHEDLGERHLLVFFGFTSCQDVCPVQMTKLTQVMTELDQSGHAELVTPVFISVDPERDRPAKVADYLRNFDRRFVGLTGSRNALKHAADSFKIFLAKAPVNGGENYQISHASSIYVVGPDSRLVAHLSATQDADEAATRVREILTRSAA